MWISYSTLLEAPELTRPRDQKTPEPGSESGGMLLPSFALSSPSGKSPQLMKTHSSPGPGPGPPLTAIQFLRRVDGVDGFLRPGTPLASDNGVSWQYGTSVETVGRERVTHDPSYVFLVAFLRLLI